MNAGPERAATSDPRHLRRLQFRLRWLARLLPSERHMPLFWAVWIGFLGAGVALLFQAGTHAVQWVFTGGRIGGYVAVFRALPDWQRVVVPLVGGLSAGLMLTLSQRMAKQKAQDYMEAVVLGDGMVPVQPSIARSLAALFSIASGASIGREGPLVQLAALAASVTGRIQRMAPARLRLLVACGAAAGIAAAYNAPIAGALFVAEIIVGSIAMEAMGPLIISSVVAALTTRIATGDAPLYAFDEFHLTSPWELLAFAVLGFVCAAGASVFLRALRGGRLIFGRVPGPMWVRLALGGAAVGLLAWRWPEVTGNGQALIREMLAGSHDVSTVALLLGLKVAAVALVFGSGAVGGVFTPSLFSGAALGLLLASGLRLLFSDMPILSSGYAVVGMGAFLAAVTQAPVMAMFMIFEMSLQYQLMLPLMVATVVAYFAARSFGSEPLYAEALRGGPRSAFDKPLGRVVAGEMMRPRMTTVSPAASFADVARCFLRAPAHELMVADADGRFAGAVLLSDVQPYLRHPDLADVVTARDIARDDVPVIDAGLGLPEALAVFSRCPHESLPVVAGEERRLVGALLRSDLFLAVSELARREGVRSAEAASGAGRPPGPRETHGG
ncbi:MAG: ClcB-like voltage-gated chloride channel protein [Planctomycetes bacterium]|nr:ClcB-like voltage-gated chloride channel protein [Planctomycetota bacterium]